MLLEVIVQNVGDAEAAAEGGADRLEVVRAIREGGLTPPMALVRAIGAATALPLRVMIRENAGYTPGPGELPVVRRVVEELATIWVRLKPDTTNPIGPDTTGPIGPETMAPTGIVIGFASAGELRLDDLASVLDAAPAMRATFHHAFDTLRDPFAAIDALAQVPQIDRILTRGGDGTAAERCDRLRAYAARAGARLAIIAGGGINDEALSVFARAGCVREVHVGRAAREGGDPEAPVSAARVRRLRALADGQALRPGSGHA